MSNIPKDVVKQLLEAYKFGQFADDFDQPLAKPIRQAVREMCDWLALQSSAAASASGAGSIADALKVLSTPELEGFVFEARIELRRRGAAPVVALGPASDAEELAMRQGLAAAPLPAATASEREQRAVELDKFESAVRHAASIWAELGRWPNSAKRDEIGQRYEKAQAEVVALKNALLGDHHA